MNLHIRIFGIALILFSFLNCNAIEKDKSTLGKMETQTVEDKNVGEDELLRLVSESVHIGEIKGGVFSINSEKEKAIIEKIKKLIKSGTKVKEQHVLELFSRDGSGENQVTSKNILQLLLTNYSGRKTEVLNKSLLLSMLNTNSEIVAYLIAEGAKPTADELTEVIANTTPDYYPSYETLKLLVEKLNFDLYKNCNVTLSWWLIQEHQSFGNSISKATFSEEVKKRKNDFFLICNKTNNGESFFDPELFPTNQSAIDLAKKSQNTELKNWVASLHKN